MALPVKTIGLRAKALFDASGRYAATAVAYPQGLSGLVVVWDLSSKRPVGQCLIDGIETVGLASGGRAVVAVDGRHLVRCAPPDRQRGARQAHASASSATR